MEIDTSKTYAFRPSMPRVVAALAFVLVFFGVSVWAAWEYAGTGDEGQFVGWLGIILFGGLFLAGLWRLRRRKEPLLTISPAGFTYAPHSRETIPWPNVGTISVREKRKTGKFITVLHPGWGRQGDMALDATEVIVDVITLPVSLDDVFALMLAFAGTYRRKGT